ncbi:DUF2500 domain-containing protein [Clostridium sp. C2-6-12]|uniref:DUF2500 domain-containing protein n=1 Tax=Clostridium sp. C2-6-12 TaxID=2698832 RepID=UPI00136DCF31|nr:DUF2500 domain-containing protein [Clostridium sp. C2-6-12]
MIGFQLIFFVTLVFIIFNLISTYVKNEKSPVIATKAQLIKKKTDTNIQTDSNGMTTTTETLILIFQLDTGSEIKFVVGGRVYRTISENEWGTLTFQGTRFLKFESKMG